MRYRLRYSHTGYSHTATGYAAAIGHATATGYATATGNATGTSIRATDSRQCPKPQGICLHFHLDAV